MRKQVVWDFNNLQSAIRFAILQTGYRNRIDVSFPLRSASVSAYCSDPLSKVAHNTCFKVMCVLSCLCIIFAPIYFLSRKKVDTIVCEFNVGISASEFYARFAVVNNRNFYQIQHHARERIKSGSMMASF
jgi:hypothetical protein